MRRASTGRPHAHCQDRRPSRAAASAQRSRPRQLRAAVGRHPARPAAGAATIGAVPVAWAHGGSAGTGTGRHHGLLERGGVTAGGAAGSGRAGRLKSKTDRVARRSRFPPARLQVHDPSTRHSLLVAPFPGSDSGTAPRGILSVAGFTLSGAACVARLFPESGRDRCTSGLVRLVQGWGMPGRRIRRCSAGSGSVAGSRRAGASWVALLGAGVFRSRCGRAWLVSWPGAVYRTSMARGCVLAPGFRFALGSEEKPEPRRGLDDLDPVPGVFRGGHILPFP